MADVTLKLTLGSFSVEVSGPEEYAERKFQELIATYLTSTLRSQAPEPSAVIAVEQGGKKLSAAEFLKKVEHKNQQDRAVALGYYLERMASQPSFTTAELDALGSESKHPFANVSESVSRLVARGLMMSAGEKEGRRAYALTASGEEYIESMVRKS